MRRLIMSLANSSTFVSRVVVPTALPITSLGLTRPSCARHRTKLSAPAARALTWINARFPERCIRTSSAEPEPGKDAAGVSFVIAAWTIRDLRRDLTGRREHPAVISFGEDGVVT